MKCLTAVLPLLVVACQTTSVSGGSNAGSVPSGTAGGSASATVGGQGSAGAGASSGSAATGGASPTGSAPTGGGASATAGQGSGTGGRASGGAPLAPAAVRPGSRWHRRLHRFRRFVRRHSRQLHQLLRRRHLRAARRRGLPPVVGLQQRKLRRWRRLRLRDLPVRDGCRLLRRRHLRAKPLCPVRPRLLLQPRWGLLRVVQLLRQQLRQRSVRLRPHPVHLSRR